jgi:hypothetical protein
LSQFNATTNKNGQYGGLVAQPVDEDGIYVKVYKGKILLWWKTPKLQIDDFVYSGDSKSDIDQCNADTVLKQRQLGLNMSQYTWHHTGCPPEESYGTMQLVPREEHACIPHVGGSAISQGKI